MSASRPRRPRPHSALGLAAALLLGGCGSGDDDAASGAARAGADGDDLSASAPVQVTPGMVAGDPDGPVVIQEFADFECPFCARHYLENHAAMEALIAEGGIRFEVYELAGPAHPEALDATVAARCAGDQGAYAEARGALYRNQEVWAGSPVADTILRALVLPLVADTSALENCLTNQRVTVGRILNQNLRKALAEGTRSTPTTVVRMGEATRVLPGIVGADAIAAAVEAVRQGAASPATPGPGTGSGAGDPGGGAGDSGAAGGSPDAGEGPS